MHAHWNLKESELMTITDPRVDTTRTPTATYREIVRQPETWRQSADLLRNRRPEITAFLAPLLAQRDLRIVLTGAGTSAFVGEIAATTLSKALDRRVEAIATTDIVSNPAAVFAQDLPTLVVSFARSGNSPESVAATNLATRVLTSAHHLVITCDEDGELARAHIGTQSLVLVLPPTTNDTGFAMTSSFSSMLLTVLGSFIEELLEHVDGLADDVARFISREEERINSLLDFPFRRVVYLGSGPLTGLARESALKMLELTAGQVVAFFDSPLGFRHGPKALVDDETLVVVFQSAEEYTAQYDDDIVAELRAAHPTHVVRVGVQEAPIDQDFMLGAPTAPDALRAVSLIVFAQLLALDTSMNLGCTPDNPFPNGSVNRVVQGVRIHPFTAEEEGR